MTVNITESDIENLTIELLKQQGFQYVPGPTIAPDGIKPKRQSFEDVILIDRLQQAVDRINLSMLINFKKNVKSKF